MIKKFFLKGMAIIAVLVCLLPLRALGIAMVSEPIVITDATRGSEITKELYLINSQSKTIAYDLASQGQIADWTSFYRLDDYELAKPIKSVDIGGSSNLVVKAKFAIPADAPNNTYKGAIIITQAVGEAQNGNVTTNVAAMLDREVAITVTDKENIKLDAAIIPVKYDVPEGESLQFKVVYNNEGNVSVKPSAQLKVVDPDDGRVLHNAIYPYPETQKAVRPYEQKEMGVLLEWPTAGQAEGVYEAQVSVLLDKTAAADKKVTFAIVNPIVGSLAANLTQFFAGKIEYFWLALGAILLLAAGFIRAVKKRSAATITS